jgi:hypothetical protein
MEENLLPNLLLIGAAKSGTTSLHKYLDQHPQIFMAKRKEPRFFLVWENPERMALHQEEKRGEINYYCTIEKYQALFAEGTAHKVRGESSTTYLANPECAFKIKKLIPRVKLVAILRNPIDRAFSNYVIYRNWRMEKKSFADAVDEEIRTGRHNYQQPMQYLYLGKYADSLKVYFNLFPADQIKVYLYDDLKADPESFMQNIFNFLEVDTTFVPDIEKKYNYSYMRRYAEFPAIDKILYRAQNGLRKFKLTPFAEMIKKNRIYKPVLKSDVRKKLLAYYEDEISELEKLLNRNFSNWRE